MSGKAKFRLLLMFALAGVCGYVGFLVFKERDPMIPLHLAEQAYGAGQMLDQKRDFKAAADKYDEAYVLVEHAYKRLNGPHGLEKEKLEEVSVNVLFLKAKALRDKSYALAAASGKPLPETRDSVTNQSYRNVLQIADSKDREEAMGSIRGAATLFAAKNYEVQLEALRLELMATPPGTPLPWDQIEKIAKAILEIKPTDSRAKYMLAKYEFEQPDPVRNYTSKPENRSAERIKLAQSYIEDVRLDPKFPVWRTEYLSAQIQFWLLNRARNKDEKKFERALDNLDMALLDEINGAVPNIRRGRGLEFAGTWDTDAVMALHALAADMAVEIIRKKKMKEFTPLALVFRDTLAFCDAKSKADDPAYPPSIIIGVMLNLMTKSQSFLATQSQLEYKTEWRTGLDMLSKLLKKEFDNDRCDPYRVAQFAELLFREAQVRRARRDPEADWVDLPVQAKKWFDDGLQYGKKHDLGNLQMAPFNMLAANVFYFNTNKRENLTPFIAALAATKNHPQAQALALVIDGACDEREGRLEKARWKFEQALRIAGGEEEVRAHASLANIFMAMGMPERAIDSLNKLREAYERFSDLSELERQWIGQFMRGPQDYFALTAIANMECARKDIAAYFQKNPKAKTFPIQLVKDREALVQTLLAKELPQIGGPGFMARIAWINYLTATRQRPKAEVAWIDLNKTYADRVELLTLKVGLMQIVAKEAFEMGNPEFAQKMHESVDPTILKWIDEHKTNQSAKLYYALWLAQTRRTAEAQQYLQRIIAESGTTNPEINRVLAAVTLSQNSPNSPLQIVRHMPRDPQIDNVLLTISSSVEKQIAEVKSALTQHESSGIARALQAEGLFAKKDYYAAAEAFAGTLDFTRIKAMAQQGVIRSLFALAARDSEKALQLNMILLNDFPKEPALLLTYAYIFLVRDEIGAPTDNWEGQGRNMGSALNVWEQHLKDETADNHAMIALTQAEFWFRANRLDVARDKTQKALSYDPKNPNILIACMNMILEDPGHEPDPKLRGYLAALRKITADATGPEVGMVNYLAGRVEEYEEKWQTAVQIYVGSLQRFPKDRTTYKRLVSLLDALGERAGALQWAKAWRSQLPNDLHAIAAEIRLLCRLEQAEQARAAAAEFLTASLAGAAKFAEQITDSDAASQKKYRDNFVQAARNQAEFELANGFFLGGELKEAETRILQLPRDMLNSPITQEILGEIYVKQKEFAKAEKVFEALVELDRLNLAPVNNLAYLLSEHQNKPSLARDVVRKALKREGGTAKLRSADRFPPEFLSTIGKIYMKLGSPDYGREMTEFFKTAMERYRNDPRILFYWGYAQELSGEFSSAEINYNRSFQKFNHPGLTAAQRVELARDIEAARTRLTDKRRAAVSR